MSTKIICRLCKRTYTPHQPIFSTSSYNIVCCPVCNFATLSPLPSPQTLKKIYANPAYHADKSVAEHKSDALTKFNYLQKKLHNFGTILDFGSGNGSFVNLLTQNGYSAIGYEPYPKDPVIIPKPFSKKLFTHHSFNTITCFDVIEHLDNFPEYLDTFKSWLKPMGHLCLTTPSLDRWDRRLFGSHWYGFSKIPQHVNYFSNKTLTQALHNAGFSRVSIINWGYVRSMQFIVAKLIHHQLPRAPFSWTPNLFVPMINTLVIATP